MSGAYYNEHDPKAASWLRELIKQRHIADGEVDERSIEDVTPMELTRFTQCHFFAGIGVWSYALRRAGWDDSHQVWTGSCPCQPFSAAGKGGGFDDERHLWPAFFHLIEQCRPHTVFGEQVASKDGLAWLNLVQSDLEGAGYAIGAVDTCAAGFGAPHIRQRLYWVADAADQRHDGGRAGVAGDGRDPARLELERFRNANLMGDTISERLERHGWDVYRARGWKVTFGPVAATEPIDTLADTAEPRHDEEGEHECGSPLVSTRPAEYGGVVRSTSSTNGFWRDADWLRCRDDKWRPVRPGSFPLVARIAAGMGHLCDSSQPLDAEATGEARTMRLRGYGNAINAETAINFIEAYREGLT